MSDLLALRQVSAGYGEAVVISNIDLRLKQGESLAVLGRNGTGKTTLLNTIIGVTRHRGGTIELAGRDLFYARGQACACRHRLGAAGAQHLQVPDRGGEPERRRPSGAWTMARVYEMFPPPEGAPFQPRQPALRRRTADAAVARALVLNPRLMLLDEPTEGLAPIIIEELLAALKRIIRDEGHVGDRRRAARPEDPGRDRQRIILDRGTIVHASSSRALIEDPTALEQHLGVTAGRSRAPRLH